MSNFTPTAQYSTEFDGDTVTMNIRRLKREDQQKLIPFMGDVDADGKMKMSFSDQYALANAMQSILPNYVSNFEGLTNADGSKVELVTAIEEVYFQGLIGDILMELMRLSKVGEKEEKGSVAPPDVFSKE